MWEFLKRLVVVLVLILIVIGVVFFFMSRPKSGEVGLVGLGWTPKGGIELIFRKVENLLSAHVGDSPVMASGGSMTFRAKKGWNCPSSTVCMTVNSFDLSEVDFSGLVPLDKTTNVLVPTAWASLASVSWQVTLNARDSEGGLTSGNYVMLCPFALDPITKQPICGAAGTSGPLLIQVKSSNNSATLSLQQGKSENYVDDTDSVVRYQDSSCSKVPDDPVCEHIGQVDLNTTPTASYKCLHGRCEIRIG